jgi:CubicO group peptidase (beta-lactamase class C family)
MSKSKAIAAAMQSAVERGVFPGAVLFVRLRGVVVHHQAVGLASRLPKAEPVEVETIYDLASLTKPLATATAVLSLIQEGRLTLEMSVQEVLKELTGAPVGSARIFHLLNHSAGLPAWRPYYERIGERDRADAERLMLELIRQESLISPIGARSIYSDLGFILLGCVVARAVGQPLESYCQTIHDTVGAAPLGYAPRLGSSNGGLHKHWSLGRIAPTEDDPWRGGIVRGLVHDENAYALGGVAGHAGLFGTATAVAAVTRSWLDGYHGRPSPFRTDLVQRFVTRQQTPGSSWGLGWDTPSPPSSSGRHFSPQAFGHLGFTGTSIWIDPVPELEVILLSNRVHPTRQNNLIRDFRPQIHDLIYDTYIGA